MDQDEQKREQLKEEHADTIASLSDAVSAGEPAPEYVPDLDDVPELNGVHPAVAATPPQIPASPGPQPLRPLELPSGQPGPTDPG